MEEEKRDSEFMGLDINMFTVADDRELMPILCKPKIIPIKSGLARQL